jgi:hypothetical protein
MASGMSQDDSLLAKQILGVDKGLVLVIIIGPRGEFLAAETPKGVSLLSLVPQDQLSIRAASFFVAYGAAEGATKFLGKMDYAVFAYEDYKVLLVRVPSIGKTASIRMRRSANTEEIYDKVSSLLKGTR